ncbi:MAG: hypothetical protein Q4E62_03995 [Sutterellaceae bacterium]|nr:hypothetical protein [Sutterellaceae bacterium]
MTRDELTALRANLMAELEVDINEFGDREYRAVWRTVRGKLIIVDYFALDDLEAVERLYPDDCLQVLKASEIFKQLKIQRGQQA